jgi:hypothetical protein
MKAIEYGMGIILNPKGGEPISPRVDIGMQSGSVEN